MYGLIGLFIFETLWCLSDMIIKPRMLTYDKGLQNEINCKRFDHEAYKSLKKKGFHLQSDFGYVLSCEFIENPNNPDKKIAVLCHGLGMAKYVSYKYMELFYKLGFSVLVYDHRNHGLSGKAHTSMGFYERFDLRKVLDWCVEAYGEDCKIITHGESMGAATVLMHLGIDPRVKCVISDCGYSDLIKLLHHQLHQFYHLPHFFIPIESCLTYLRAGFWYKQVSPIKVVSETDTPILFIHGKIDNLVPASMSKQMYQCKKDKKAIYLVAKAKHAQSYCVNKKGYEAVVRRFLNTYLK